MLPSTTLDMSLFIRALPASSALLRSPSSTVVTGVSGFIGSEIMLAALEAGHRVRGAVRRKEQGEAFFEAYPGIPRDDFEFVLVADMTKEGAWVEAIKGVDAVVHAASPVNSDFVVTSGA